MNLLRKIPFGFAVNYLMGMIALIILFHLLVLFGVVPYEIVWGGRLKTTGEMYRFEFFSILVNFVLLLVVAVKVKKIRVRWSGALTNILLWAFILIFFLNTLGNMYSDNFLESVLFTPITFVATFMLMRLVMEH
jgi:hypothetical protein